MVDIRIGSLSLNTTGFAAADGIILIASKVTDLQDRDKRKNTHLETPSPKDQPTSPGGETETPA